MEEGIVQEVISEPLHPYTAGLLHCVPRLAAQQPDLNPIEGIVPPLTNLPRGCSFSDRCPVVIPECEETAPELKEVSPTRKARCHRCQMS